MKTVPPRLLTAASFVEKGAVVADVGCDHALLPHYLLKEGIADFAYLIDKNKGPLMKAGENTEKYGLSGRCALVLSDGLKKLPGFIEENDIPAGYPDTVIITGMGGPLILRILEETPFKIKENVRDWILSPQSLIDDFRNGIPELGLKIIEESEVVEKKRYMVFRVRR